MRSKSFQWSDNPFIRKAITRGIVHNLLRESDPRLQNLQLCNSCGSCTPYCPGLLNSGLAEGNGRYLPRKVNKSLQAGRIPDFDISECVQCYSCETACPKSISIGGIINAIYEAEDKWPLFRRMIRTRGQLPPEAFLPLYFDRERIGNYIAKSLSYPYSVAPSAIDDVKTLFAHPLPPSCLAPPPYFRTRKPPARVDRVFHLRSCCTFNYLGADRAQRYIYDRLGIEYATSDEQSCCGGAPYYMGGVGYTERLILASRNLAVIRDTLGSDGTMTITGICPTCSDTYTTTLDTLSKQKNRRIVNATLSNIGRSLDASTQFEVANILDLYPLYLDELRRLMDVRLSGLRVGVHVSCHYKKMTGTLALPTSLSDLVAITGGKPVRSRMEYYCCGGVKQLFDRYLGGQKTLLPRLNRDVQKDFAEHRLDLMVVDCPGCELVYDHMGVPVMHVTEFLALAMGADLKHTIHVRNHMTSLKPALRKIGIV